MSWVPGNERTAFGSPWGSSGGAMASEILAVCLLAALIFAYNTEFLGVFGQRTAGVSSGGYPRRYPVSRRSSPGPLLFRDPEIAPQW